MRSRSGFGTLVVVGFLLALGAGCQGPSTWSGTWADATRPEHAGDLHCTVQQIASDRWEGQFTGYCGRQFAYEVTMQGVREDDGVLFRGAADLGKEGGGQYQWTGRMNEEQFTGSYQSDQGKRGTFSMRRQDPDAPGEGP